jgi:ribosome biogenesis protein BMS1
MSLVRLRLKRHRWSPRQLKNEDPLVFSIGWRRFQSIPLYSIRDDMQERNRFLKYTPEHMHCEATIWAPTTPTNVGFLAYQTVSARAAAFRIAATGTVLELDDKFRVMKKLKLVGTPTKVFRNTALIRGMFNSDLEVAKFSDAKIRTVSGIRGRVRKAIKDGAPGTFRAVFEDKVLHSDIVILKTWAPVETKRFCHNVTSLLVPASFEDAFDRRQKLLGLVEGDDDYKGGRDEEMAEAEAREDTEAGSAAPAASSASARAAARVGDVADDTGGLLLMRPMRQLRRDHGVLVQDKQSSWYQPQERHEKRFFPLRIPERLQAKLPFASKPKQLEARNRLAYAQKRAVVLEDHERRTLSTLQRVHTVRKAREKKTKQADDRRKQAKDAVAAREAAKWAPAAKAQKKEEYREMGKQNSKRLKRQQEQRGDG